MDIHRSWFDDAVARGLISAEQSKALLAFFDEKGEHTPSFKAAHTLYYLGGAMAMGALSWFVTLVWDSWAGWPMVLLAVSFAVLGLSLTERFLKIAALHAEFRGRKEQLEKNEELRKLLDEAQAMRDQASEYHDHVTKYAELAQEYHDQMIATFKEADQTRAEADAPHKEFVKAQEAADEQHKEFIRTQREVRDFEKVLWA